MTASRPSPPARPAPSPGPRPAPPRIPRAAARAALARVLRGASYEVLPFAGTEEKVLAHVPRAVPLSVTTTQARGQERTVELATRLAGHGYAVAPHLAARQIRDRAELGELVDRLGRAGVDQVFVVAGDAPDPAGEFSDALALLRALAERGHPFAEVGIAGYPEGHGLLGTERVERALVDKAPHATRVVTQLCFATPTTLRWADSLAPRGVTLPVRVGVPGAVGRQKLLRVSAGLGLGASARILRKQQSLLLRFLLPGGYRPDRLLRGLAPAFAAPTPVLAGLHVFTFNELAATQAWRTALLAELAGPDHEEPA